MSAGETIDISIVWDHGYPYDTPHDWSAIAYSKEPVQFELYNTQHEGEFVADWEGSPRAEPEYNGGDEEEYVPVVEEIVPVDYDAKLG